VISNTVDPMALDELIRKICEQEIEKKGRTTLDVSQSPLVSREDSAIAIHSFFPS
jgi:hypothetical protein